MKSRIASMTITAVVACAIGWLIAPSIAGAEVIVQTRTSYYPVKGKTGKALNAAMLSGGRGKISLSHAVAATETEIEFTEPRIVVNGNKCIVDDVDVILKIHYIYPKWVNKGSASKATRKHWSVFWRELKRHEENHGAIALAGAKALERELMNMNGAVAIGCANFGAFAGMKLKNIVRKTTLAQKNFDRREYAANSKISKLQRMLYESK